MIRSLTVHDVAGVQGMHVELSEDVSIADIPSSLRAAVNDVECTPYTDSPHAGDGVDFDCGETPPGRVVLEVLAPIPARNGDGVLMPRSIVLDPYSGLYSDPFE